MSGRPDGDTLLQDRVDGPLADFTSGKRPVASIDDLPNELLLAVLLDAMPPDAQRGTSRHKELSNIQQRWWKTICYHPEFWTTLYATDSPAELTLKLRKSGDKLLNIDCEDCEDEEVTEGFLGIVSPHIERWESFKIQALSMDPIRDYVNKPMPNLSRLVLEIATEAEMIDMVLGIQAPKLRDVRLDGVALQFEQGILSNLTILVLNHFDRAMLPVSQLISSLRRCPKLEVLSLEWIPDCDEHNEPPEPEEAPDDQDLVHLPHLKELGSWLVNGDLCHSLLHLLRFPSHAKFLFSPFYREVDLAQVFQRLTTPRANQSSLLAFVVGHPDAAHLDVTTTSTWSGGESFTISGISNAPTASSIAHIHHSHTPSSKTVTEITFEGHRCLDLLTTNTHLLPFADPSFPLPVHLKFSARAMIALQAGSDSIVSVLPTLESVELSGSAEPAMALLDLLEDNQICPRLTMVKLNSELGRHIGNETKWNELMVKIAEVLEQRRDVQVFDHEGNIVDNLASYPFLFI